MPTLRDIMATQSDKTDRVSWRTLGTMVVVVVWAALLGPLVAASPARADVTFDQKMLELINQQRAANGVGPVQPSLVLGTIAGPGPYLGCGFLIGGRADDMGGRNYFSHTILNCGSQSVFNVLSSTIGLVYSAAGENIAWMNGTTDPNVAAQRLMNDLMNSPGHRANILDARYTHVGIGSWRSAAGQTWAGGGTPLSNVWITTQVFAQMPLTAVPGVSLTPTSLSFGDRGVGTPGPTQGVTLKNGGSATLNISSTSVVGSNARDFTIATNSCGVSLAAGASCTIALGFTPGAAGLRSGTLSISDNAPGAPHTVPLNGTGTAAPLAGTPSNVLATGGDGQMTVTWTAPASGALPVNYGVFVFDASGYIGKSASACGTCTTATVTGLTNGRQEYAAVYGYNGAAWGGAGVSNTIWVLAVPGAPTNHQALPGDRSLTMTWRAPVTLGAGIDGYAMYVYDPNGYTGKYAWVCAACTSATVAGLTNGASYYAVVYAHNSNGWGPMAGSSWVMVGTPSPPGDIAVTPGSGQVKVTWSPAPDSGSPVSAYVAYLYDSGGNTGLSSWVCGTCNIGVIPGMVSGRPYRVFVYAYNAVGWSLPAISPSFTSSV